jgi:2-amino-4-hydroxy-6-hydroxymethyldihydropteridine diphosphokinase
MKSSAWIGFGANIGEPADAMITALKRLFECGFEIVAVSHLYNSSPIGPQDQPDFVNAVIVVRSVFEPDVILEHLLRIEVEAGRRARGHWRERELDLDLLAVDCKNSWLYHSDTSLELPHPRIDERLFVLLPMLELDSEMYSPLSGVQIRELVKSEKLRSQNVERIEEVTGWCPKGFAPLR